MLKIFVIEKVGQCEQAHFGGHLILTLPHSINSTSNYFQFALKMVRLHTNYGCINRRLLLR